MLTTLILAGLAAQQTASCCPPTMNAFLADPSFIASHLSPLPMKFRARAGKTVSFATPDGTKASGFFVPATNSSVGIVMVHEWWGLNDHIRQEAENLHAKTGYAVLAVDMYDGKVASTPAEAGKLTGSMNPVRGGAIVKGAVGALKNGTLGIKASHIGSIGWCFGGGWSFQTALQNGSDVEACVMYYGMPETDPAKLAALKAPVLFIWGHQDKWINDALADKFAAGMKAAGKSVTEKGYDADHAFANPSNPKYNAPFTADAMARTLAFYKAHLK